MIASALHKLQSTAPRPAAYALPKALEHALRCHAPRLLDPHYAAAVATLGEHPWVRDIVDWRPRGKSPRTKLEGLLRHLLVRYDMPTFMFRVFSIEDERLRRMGIELFVHLGQGGSLFRLVKEGRFPVPLTRRMCHLFMQSPAQLSLLEAIRRAQVTALGGVYRVATTILATRQLGQGLTDDEAFWAGVIHWTCNQEDIPPGQLGPVYDWIARRRQADPKFSMKGRTGGSVQQAMMQWHGLLAHEDGGRDKLLPASGFAGWHHERVGKHDRLERYSITEIRNTQDLAQEGKALRHCVFTYITAVRHGLTSIWSYKVNGRRKLTVEVDHRGQKVVQCRGKANRLPSRAELVRVECFAASNGLTLHPMLPVE